MDANTPNPVTPTLDFCPADVGGSPLFVAVALVDVPLFVVVALVPDGEAVDVAEALGAAELTETPHCCSNPTI
jgi:hypothetical protein